MPGAVRGPANSCPIAGGHRRDAIKYHAQTLRGAPTLVGGRRPR